MCSAAQVDILLPYYFQVLGLGASPLDTIAKPGPDGIGLEVGQQPGEQKRRQKHAYIQQIVAETILTRLLCLLLAFGLKSDASVRNCSGGLPNTTLGSKQRVALRRVKKRGKPEDS